MLPRLVTDYRARSLLRPEQRFLLLPPLLARSRLSTRSSFSGFIRFGSDTALLVNLDGASLANPVGLGIQWSGQVFCFGRGQMDPDSVWCSYVSTGMSC